MGCFWETLDHVIQSVSVPLKPVTDKMQVVSVFTCMCAACSSNSLLWYVSSLGCCNRSDACKWPLALLVQKPSEAAACQAALGMP
jgi:hypothetical protein